MPGPFEVCFSPFDSPKILLQSKRISVGRDPHCSNLELVIMPLLCVNRVPFGVVVSVHLPKARSESDIADESV